MNRNFVDIAAAETDWSKAPCRAGVYLHTSSAKFKPYIGQSGDIPKRLQKHDVRIDGGRHHSKVQRFYDKYGAATFIGNPIYILLPSFIESAPREEVDDWLDAVETQLIADYDAVQNGLNTCVIGGKPPAGDVLSEINRKRYKDPEARAKASEVQRKRWEDPAARAKNIAAIRKRWEDPATRAKTSASVRKYFQDNPEARAKLSAVTKELANRPEVIAKRLANGGAIINKVAVEGSGKFSSVHHAFGALGVYERGNPWGHHKSFRAALKKAGALTYTEMDGRQWHFSIIERGAARQDQDCKDSCSQNLTVA